MIAYVDAAILIERGWELLGQSSVKAEFVAAHARDIVAALNRSGHGKA
jgi:hypothetical protein